MRKKAPVAFLGSSDDREDLQFGIVYEEEVKPKSLFYTVHLRGDDNAEKGITIEVQKSYVYFLEPFSTEKERYQFEFISQHLFCSPEAMLKKEFIKALIRLKITINELTDELSRHKQHHESSPPTLDGPR